MTRFRRHPIATPVLVAMLLIAALAGGCAEEQTSIDLSTVSMPEGGTVYTVAVLDGEDRLDVVTPSRMGLFVHRNDSGPWHLVNPRWPDNLAERQSAPLQALGAAGDTLNFPHSQVFTAHKGRLWMVTGVPGPDGTQLLMSDTVGRTWTTVALPEAIERAEAAQEDAADQGGPSPTATVASVDDLVGASLGVTPAAHVRLLNLGEDGLYLVGASQLWRLHVDDESLPDEPWEPISLDGIDDLGGDAGASLPAMVRHYLPATSARPFELLTVLRDRLAIYRRSSDADEWKQIATLDDADRELIGIPDSDGVLMLTRHGLMRSTNAAEVWQPIALPPMPQDQHDSVSLELLAPTDQESAVALLALQNGAIYRSDDLSRGWTEVRPSDADHREIAGFTHSQQRNRVWAATRGGGVLRSLDRGRTWHQINEDLRATRAFDMGVDENGGFLLGTDSGLFRLTGSPSEGRWQMLQDRSTTSIHVEMDSGAIINGTANGAIVRLEPDGKTTTAEAAPSDELDDIVYRPMRFRGVDLPARAIVDIETRPDSQHVFAWSGQEGPLTSLDGGVSWTRMLLNPAFQSALEGSYLSNFTTDFGERMYLVTHPLSSEAPTQLWRSYNNGETWHAVSSFVRDEHHAGIFIARSAAYPPEVLFMARGDRFATSIDGGHSWRDLPGRWEDGRVLTYHIDGEDHLLAIDTRHVTNLVRVRQTDEETPQVDAFTLQWPTDSRSRRTEIRGVAVNGNRLYLSTPAGVLSGQMPDGQQRLPDGLALLLTVVSVLGLTTIGFGILRWKT